MSRAPTGIVARSFSRMAAAMRRASGTPRRWIPMRSRPSVPACFSTISWERRIVARRISSAVMIRRPVIAPSRPHWAPEAASRDRVRRSVARIPEDVPSVDVHGDVGHATPRAAAADLEEVRAVQVDDAALLLRPVVADHPLDAAAAPTDDHGRPVREAHGGRPRVVERGLAPKRVLRRLAALHPVRIGLVDGLAARRTGRRRLAWLDEAVARVDRAVGHERAVEAGDGKRRTGRVRWDRERLERSRGDRLEGARYARAGQSRERDQGEGGGEHRPYDQSAGSHDRRATIRGPTGW